MVVLHTWNLEAHSQLERLQLNKQTQQCTTRPTDPNERQCALFETVFQGGPSTAAERSLLLLYTDLADSCPCKASETVDVSCAAVVTDSFPGQPASCTEVVTGGEESVELPVCPGTFNTQNEGTEAYKAYCMETFESIQQAVAIQAVAFDEAFAEYAELFQDLSYNRTLPSISVQVIAQAYANLEIQYVWQEIVPVVPCLEACAYFVATACCQDVGVPPPTCRGIETETEFIEYCSISPFQVQPM